MKNRFIYLFSALLMLFTINSCAMFERLFHRDQSDTENVIGSTPNMYQINYEYTGYQVDSMCVADSLPQNFDSWLRRAYQDYETNEYVVRYMYILDLNNNNEMIYIVTPRDGIYVVSKRKVVSE